MLHSLAGAARLRAVGDHSQQRRGAAGENLVESFRDVAEAVPELGEIVGYLVGDLDGRQRRLGRPPGDLDA